MSDSISRQKVIDTIDKYISGFDAMDANFLDGLKTAKKLIKELPSAQPEQTDCEYCHEDSDGYVKPIEKNNHAFVRFGMDGWELDLTANGWHGRAKIRYCPMCGRDLYVK